MGCRGGIAGLNKVLRSSVGIAPTVGEAVLDQTDYPIDAAVKIGLHTLKFARHYLSVVVRVHSFRM